MAGDKFNLLHLLDHGLSSEDNEEVIVIFQSAFNCFSKSAADAQAQEVASQIQGLITPEKPAAQFGSIWEAFLSTARNIPYRDADGQDFVVNVIRILVATPPWNGLPGLAQVMRTNWSGSCIISSTNLPQSLLNLNPDPTFETGSGEESDDDEFSFSEWLNLNSFNARLLGAGLVPWESFAIWQMRQALEEALPPSPATDLRLSVASEWIIRAGPALLRKCLVARQDTTEDDKRSHGPGPLFSGQGALNLERWRFWQRRFGELRSVVAGEEAIVNVDLAMRCMTVAASAFAHTDNM